MDVPGKINVLLRTLPGLSLPPTVSFTLSPAATTSDLLNHLTTILPPSLSSRLTVTTTSNRAILASTSAISTLVCTPSNSATDNAGLLPIDLRAPLPGGKGGFGSQLRAAGGRMSSRKRKNALASDPNAGVGSNRNLDGRRLRTITEAKNLAEYLATKPEMERREKEERRRRWEAVVEAAEKREQDIRRGGTGARGKGLSEEWLEEREDAGERTRDAVRMAMSSGGWTDSIAGRAGGADGDASANESGSAASREPSEEDSDDQDHMDLDENEVKVLEKEAADGDVDAIWVLQHKVEKPTAHKQERRRYIGFDDYDDEEFMSSSGGEEDVSKAKAKGKQKAST